VTVTVESPPLHKIGVAVEDALTKPTVTGKAQVMVAPLFNVTTTWMVNEPAVVPALA
jgi:hypothetical protein